MFNVKIVQTRMDYEHEYIVFLDFLFDFFFSI